MTTPPEPPVAIEGERKEMAGCTSFTHRGDGGYFKMTFFNYSIDKEYTFSYSVTNVDSATALGDTQTLEPGKFQVTVFPGDVKEFFEGTYIGGWRGGYSWKSPPSKEWREAQNAKYMEIAPRHIDAVKQLIGIDDPMSLSSEQIANICQSRGIPFVDLHFPPLASPTIYRDFEKTGASLHTADICNRTLPFLRPTDFLPDFKTGTQNPELFSGKIEIDESCNQGELGDCYFICSVIALCEHPKRLKNLFLPLQQNPDLGIWRVRLCKSEGTNGWFETYTLDDYFPTDNRKRIFCCNKAEREEMYGSLLEKAYAKAHGSHKAIVGGSAGVATSDLTGSPYQALSELECWDDAENRYQALWDYLLQADQDKHIISLSTPQMSEGRSNEEYDKMGLAKSHAWTCISLHEFNGVKLMRISNPWRSSTEWTGRFSDGDDSDEANAMREELGFKKGDDGTFIMTFDEALGSGDVNQDWFSGGYVIFHLEHCARICARGAWENAVPSFAYKITILDGSIGEDIDLYCDLHQRDRRGLPDEDPDNKYQAIRVSIGKQSDEDAGGYLEPIALSHHKYFMQSRDQFARTKINAAEAEGSVYWCLPLCYDEDCCKKFNCTLYVSHPYAVKVEIVSVGTQERHLTRSEYFDPTQCEGAGSPAAAQIGQPIQVTLPASIFPSEGTLESVCTFELPEVDGTVNFDQAHELLTALNEGRQARHNVVADLDKSTAAIARLNALIETGEIPEETDEFTAQDPHDAFSAAQAPKPAKLIAQQQALQADEAEQQVEPWEPQYAEGDEVMARFKPGRKYFRGAVAVVDADTRTYGIQFEDGDFSYNILESDIQPVSEAEALQDDYYQMIHAHVFKPKQLVQARFKGGPVFANAIVMDMNPDRTYALKYDDGNTAPSVPHEDIREASDDQLNGQNREFSEGERVVARWKAGAVWYPAIIASCHFDEDTGMSFFNVNYSPTCSDWYVPPHLIRSIEEHQMILAEHNGCGFEDDGNSRAALWDMFCDADHDGSGYLDKTECLAVFSAMFPDESIAQVLQRIQAADINSDGCLDFEEFYNVAKDTLGRNQDFEAAAAAEMDCDRHHEDDSNDESASSASSESSSGSETDSNGGRRRRRRGGGGGGRKGGRKGRGKRGRK